MSLTTIYGINGIGKDTIVEELIKRNPKLKATSMSRINMYLLGITNTYDLKEKVTEKQYKMLEETPQKIMVNLENNQYRKLLEELSKEDNDIIFIGHLISSLRLGEEITYLTDRLTPGWFIKLNKNLIQLKAPINMIADRRKNDKSRKRSENLAEIKFHQQLCDKEWERIKKITTEMENKMYIVNNIDLDTAVREVESIVFDKNIKNE